MDEQNQEWTKVLIRIKISFAFEPYEITETCCVSQKISCRFYGVSSDRQRSNSIKVKEKGEMFFLCL